MQSVEARPALWDILWLLMRYGLVMLEVSVVVFLLQGYLTSGREVGDPPPAFPIFTREHRHRRHGVQLWGLKCQRGWVVLGRSCSEAGNGNGTNRLGFPRSPRRPCGCAKDLSWEGSPLGLRGSSCGTTSAALQNSRPCLVRGSRRAVCGNRRPQEAIPPHLREGKSPESLPPPGAAAFCDVCFPENLEGSDASVRCRLGRQAVDDIGSVGQSALLEISQADVTLPEMGPPADITKARG